ncbi:MAG: tetratricopeptide (TPR) repeat protein [Saprospiraceae bacterium]
MKAKDVMESSSNFEFKARLEKALWQNYKHLDNFEKALEHYEKMTEMESQIAIEDVEKSYVKIETRYNLAVKENQIQTLEESKLKSNRNLLLLLLSLSLISGTIIWKKTNLFLV